MTLEDKKGSLLLILGAALMAWDSFLWFGLKGFILWAALVCFFCGGVYLYGSVNR